MSYLSFGDELRNARERQGLEVGTVARELRLRPDLIRAIEDSDFSRIPQDGYARNMVIAYARMLGLNSREIVRMYENELNGSQRRSARNSAAETSRSARNTRGQFAASVPLRSQTARGQANQGGYSNFYSGPQAQSAIMQHLPLIIAGVIILVLLIIVLVLAFGSRSTATTASTDTPKVQITGVSDPTSSGEGTSDSSATTTPQVLVAPTSVEVTYKIQSSEYSQLSVVITADGNEEEQLASLPLTGSATVTDTWSIACWLPEAVTVTVDGEEVEQSGTNDAGMPLWTVNFADYLAKWNEEHPGANATVTSTNTANTASSSTGTTSAGSTTSDAAGTSGTSTNTSTSSSSGATTSTLSTANGSSASSTTSTSN